MGLLPTAGAAHRALVPGQSLPRVPTISGWGRGSAVTQLEIGHYLNSRLLRAELRCFGGRLDARPGPRVHAAPLGGRSVCGR